MGKSGMLPIFEVFELFFDILFFPEVPKFRATSCHNASARRIDPRYPEVHIRIFKCLIFFDFLTVYTRNIADFQ